MEDLETTGIRMIKGETSEMEDVTVIIRGTSEMALVISAIAEMVLVISETEEVIGTEKETDLVDPIRAIQIVTSLAPHHRHRPLLLSKRRRVLRQPTNHQTTIPIRKREVDLDRLSRPLLLLKSAKRLAKAPLNPILLHLLHLQARNQTPNHPQIPKPRLLR